jgi:dihydroorotate dehydrogenase (fumarate)
MADLRTQYLDFDLAHPIVASASPLSRDFDAIRRLEDAGAAAIVLPSIYQEQIEAEDEHYFNIVEHGAGSQPEAEGYFSNLFDQVGGLEARLETIRRAKEACHVPIIASLNGSARSGWTSFAREIQDAGASAIELNLYRVPSNIEESSQVVEQGWLQTIREVREAVRVPLAVKLGPWISSPGHFAHQAQREGVNALCLFNRFYQPDIDLSTLQHRAGLQLSKAYEMRQVLLWISLLFGKLPGVGLAATTGVQTHEEVVKYLLCGADVVMTASALLRHGVGYLENLRMGLDLWLDAHRFPSVQALRGLLAASKLGSTEELLRAQYIETLASR